MIKAILFDVGGVYLEGSFNNFLHKANGVLGVDKNSNSKKEVTFDPGLNRGEIAVEECFKKYFGVEINSGQMRKIIDLWTSTWQLSDEMEKLVIKLKRDYKLAVLSNSDLLNSQNYTKKGWYRHFDVLILSHEIGFLKPEREIYEIAIRELEVDAGECLFIDDQEDCLKPAREMGMETILFRSISQLKEDLRNQNIEF
ncbi:MAG: HAD-IA family hydrolase [Candidatus Nealsonbacteria bacterium]|nr:HAD-IA family hydrolase [Candidatus Nealsonbacteria bacterium]